MGKNTWIKICLYLLIFWTGNSCANKSNEENLNTTESQIDTIGSVQGIEFNENKPGDTADTIVFNIDFPLDSLLSFDSEKELIKAFGKNVKRSVGYYPEGMGEYLNTLLFPGTKNEVEFVWKDDSLRFDQLMYIKIKGKGTDWKTIEGITIGTGIQELENYNQKPFTFFGLGWDFSGSINWDDGQLENRHIHGRLEYPGNSIPEEFNSLLGSHEIKSSSETAQNAKLILEEIVLKRRN